MQTSTELQTAIDAAKARGKVTDFQGKQWNLESKNRLAQWLAR